MFTSKLYNKDLKGHCSSSCFMQPFLNKNRKKAKRSQGAFVERTEYNKNQDNETISANFLSNVLV